MAFLRTLLPGGTGGQTRPRPSMLRELRSLLAPDLDRNAHLDDKITLVVWRFGQVTHDRPGRVAFVCRRLHGVADAVWTRGVIGAQLPRSAYAGPGLRLPHSGRGVIIHADARLGSGVTMYHRVTLGVRGGTEAPTIGSNVYIGSGAAVLGGVYVADGSSIGANAVVVQDIAAGSTAAGVPTHHTRAPR